MRNLIFFGMMILSLAAWRSTYAQQDPFGGEVEQVFAFDAAHPNVLPANKVRALSMALAFGDQDGVEILLQRFKRHIH